MHVFTVLLMVNHFETYFVAYYAYFTAELYTPIGRCENVVFVIMSTRDRIRLISRNPHLLAWLYSITVQKILILSHIGKQLLTLKR